MLTYHTKRKIAGYLYISPWLIGFLVLVFGSMMGSFILSFFRWDVINPPRFRGLQNYIKLFTDDRFFWKSLKATTLYSLSIPLLMTLSLFLAVLLNRDIKGRGFFRTIFYLPSVISGVAVALLWRWIFNQRFGVFNVLLDTLFGIQGPAWLMSEFWVIPSFIIMSLWGFGGPMLIYLAALQNVPTTLYDAAEVDGAGPIRKFFAVTLPMISPVILFNLVMSVIRSFQIFVPAYVMTEGGPNYASLMYVLYIFRNGFEYYKMGYASALGWILFVIVLLLTLAIFKSSSAWTFYSSNKD